MTNSSVCAGNVRASVQKKSIKCKVKYIKQCKAILSYYLATQKP